MTDSPDAITVQELDGWRSAGRALTLLDVREPWELEICRFPEALSIPLQTLPGRIGEVPADRPVVVLCHHGMRSQQAVMWLRRNGVGNAVNLDGGIDAWAREIEPEMGVY
ncbi:MAG TPA: rhodanese-like domain-containing protein [Aliidongia sp.]|nr:rhodanese-like domain-containing protein [Aliidongia sp.]